MIYTGYFGSTRSYAKAGLVPVSIAVSTPDWSGVTNSYPALAPDPWTLKWPEERYTRHYANKVMRLDPVNTAEQLQSFGENVVLLCWEKPSEFCHRHLVARWLNKFTDCHVEEYELKKAAKPKSKQMMLF